MREKEKVKEIPKDVYTVEEKVAFIKDTLKEKKEVKFESLFKVYSKNEIITTFQALLEMLKRQFIFVEQATSFGAINIKLNPNWNLEEITSEQFDEYN